MKEHFDHPQSAELVAGLDEVALHYHGREPVFNDFLTMGVCALAGRTMEEEFLRTVQPYVAGTPGTRDVDKLARPFGRLVEMMDETRADILGNVFQGAITRGQNAQYFTPDPVCELTARQCGGGGSTVCDPCCGSERMLLAAARVERKQLTGRMRRDSYRK